MEIRFKKLNASCFFFFSVSICVNIYICIHFNSFEDPPLPYKKNLLLAESPYFSYF
ncbi:hypothetical protein LguiA_008408 [Lonicera macranthoides]